MSEAVSPPTFHESENITTTEDETKLSTEELRKKANNYAFATSNMGYGKKKKKLILKFWEIAWPELVELGWNKVGQIFLLKAGRCVELGNDIFFALWRDLSSALALLFTLYLLSFDDANVYCSINLFQCALLHTYYDFSYEVYQ